MSKNSKKLNFIYTAPPFRVNLPLKNNTKRKNNTAMWIHKASEQLLDWFFPQLSKRNRARVRPQLFFASCCSIDLCLMSLVAHSPRYAIFVTQNEHKQLQCVKFMHCLWHFGDKYTQISMDLSTYMDHAMHGNIVYHRFFSRIFIQCL